MKAIDFDKLFDEKLTEYMELNKGKYTEKQWENLIPKLYKSFGDTYIKKYDATPKQYYAKMDDDTLAETLKTHLEEGISVPDFLCMEIEKRGASANLLSLLESDNTETLSYVINLLGANKEAMEKYLSIVVEEKGDADVRDLAVDMLKEDADLLVEKVIAYCKAEKSREAMLEILSKVKTPRDDVFELLLSAFLEYGEKMPMRASYLASYGDDRALFYLLEKIEDESIGFVPFQELKYAIESLGGEYNKPRDFSDDNDFAIIGEASEKEGFSLKN